MVVESSRSSEDSGGLDVAKWVVIFVLIAGAFAVLWWLRPLWHGIVYSIYITPWVTVPIVLGVLGAVLMRRGEKMRKKGVRVVALGFVTVAVVVLVAGFVLTHAYAMEQLASDVDVEGVDALPGTDVEQLRVLPRSVAQQYAENSLQYPRYRLGISDITMLNGTPYWSYHLQPDGLVNTIRLQGKGAVYVDMSMESKQIQIREDELTVAPGLLLTDNLGWRLVKTRYLAEYGDPYTVPFNGEVYTAVPVVTHRFHFRFPIPYTTPQWGGTALIAPSGDITFLSPEEAQSHEVLQGQRLYPFDLTEKIVAAQNYEKGFINVWFYHEDQFEIADVPGDRNSQPFLVLTQEGMKYVVAVEPFGNAQGIYQIWIVDARFGNVQRYRTSLQDAMLGPAKAAQYVRKEDRQTDWDRFTPSEPLPVVQNDTLFWNIRVQPNDSSGVAYTALVDAQSAEVTGFEDTESLRAFLRGGGGTQRSIRTEPGNASFGRSDGFRARIQIIAPNGTVVDEFVTDLSTSDPGT